MKYFMCFAMMIASGCANVATTKFHYTDPSGAYVTVEMPKEVQAKDLVVMIHAKEGKAEIHASTWISVNAETIKAQGERESVITESISKGALEGAMKGVNPLP